MIILFIIALFSTWLIIKPVETHIPVYDKFGVEQGEVIQTPTLMDGLPESWKEYPEYNTGLGFIATIAFVGAVLVCSIMVGKKEGENESLLDRK
ncbi:hypothetical protein ES703_82651 [subsurface metagenome]